MNVLQPLRNAWGKFTESTNYKLAEYIVTRGNGLKGMTDLSGLVLGAVIAIVALFIGLFMISKVSDVTAIDGNSSFYSTFSSLVTNTGTIYDVLILVVIVVALGIAIAVLKGFARSGPTTAV